MVMDVPMAGFRPAYLVALALSAVASVSPAWAQAARPQDIELVKALRDGGHVILMRHFQADPDGADRSPKDFKNLRQQQQLTESGRGTARVVGNWFKVIGLPIGEVVSSRFNRCLQSAQLAGLTPVKATDDLTEGSLVETPNENRRRAKALRALISAPIPIRQNRVIVTHRVSIQNALGKEWFEVKEGEASIFKVTGASYSLVTRIQSDEWSRIAQAARELDQPAPAAQSPAPQTAPQPPAPSNGTALPQSLPSNGNGKKP
jgi:broad specificity phosphatase PhoE